MSAPAALTAAFQRNAPAAGLIEPKAPLAAADPDRLAKVCLSTGRQLAARGQDAAAIEQFEKAVSFDPSIDPTHELAVLYGRIGDATRSMQLFKDAIDKSPQDAELLSDYGYFLYSIGRFPEAEETLRKSLAIETTPTAQANLACALVARGQHEEASRLLCETGSVAEAHLSVAMLAAHRGNDRVAAEYAARAADDPLMASKAREIASQISRRSPGAFAR